MIAVQLLPLFVLVVAYLLYAVLWWHRRQRGYIVELRPDSETAVAIGRTVLQPGERLHIVPDHPTPTPPADPVSTATAKQLEKELFGDLGTDPSPNGGGGVDTE